MDKNFFIAILLMTLIILIYSSPFYQKRFGHESPQTVTETTDNSVDEPVVASQPTSLNNSKPDTLTAIDTIDNNDVYQVNMPAEPKIVTIENSDIQISIDTKGGSIVQATMLKFHGPDDDTKALLIPENGSWSDGYVSDDNFEKDFTDLIFDIDKINEQKVVLTATFSDLRKITREYIVNESGYILKSDIKFDGPWIDPHLYISWHGSLAETEKPFRQIKIWPFSMFMRDDHNQYIKAVYLGQGDRIITPERGKQKNSRIYENEGSQKVEINKEYGTEDTFNGDLSWYGIRSKYFTSIVIPEEKNRWSAQSSATLIKGEKHFDFTIHKPLSSGNQSIEIYCGPISYFTLKGYSRNLTEIMELSWRIIRPLSISFLWVIQKLHKVIPNWGIVLIIFSLIIKVVLYPLSRSSIESMRRMSQLQPQIAELREKHKSNPQKQQAELMDLYRREKINPMGGCLPLLLQMPVFFALYPVIGRAFELRQALFVPYWIEDLSRPDPFFILPIAMGASMFFQQKSTVTDPSQKAMIYVMPFMMIIIFINLSAGLVLYWFMFNVMTYIQQKYHSKTPTMQQS